MYYFLYLDLASENLRDLIVSTAPSKIREQNNIRTEALGHTSQGARLFRLGASSLPTCKSQSPTGVSEPGDVPVSTQHLALKPLT